MKFWQSIKNAFAQPATVEPPHSAAPAAAPKPETLTPPDELTPDQVQVAQVQAAQVQAALASDQPPLLLDVRERFEWEQVRIAAARHIPMNDVPEHLTELPRERPIVVFCAHGSRSFGVAHYLREQGFAASNLEGGITQWRLQGGEVETGRM